MLTGTWGATGSGWGSGATGGGWGSGAGSGTWSTIGVAPSAPSGNIGTFSFAPAVVAPPSVYNVVPGGALIGSPGGGLLSTAGPYGEGIYTPLDYPAMRFLNESETLSQLPVGSFQFSASGLKSIAILALILFAAKKL